VSVVARSRRRILLASALLAIALGCCAAPAGAVTIAPPWCGTPEPDAAGALPDGSQPTDPPGSFAHIPYYAIGCTLDAIKAESRGRRMATRVFGHSALGRPMYLVTLNALDTPRQRRDFARWQTIRALALRHPAAAQALLDHYGGDVKVPIYIQSGIHGNEYEGVDAMMLLINRLATTPRGADSEVDRILDHAIVVFNTDQNPDGRAAGTRTNGNGFDLNRDFLTQSQPEVKASVTVMQQWLFPDELDQHGYLSPTLIEATTKPHNPGIDYDLWLKWNQPRTAANKDALAAERLAVQRPVNDWCSNGDLPRVGATLCDDGSAPGPAVAEGWDDWGPFYTPMYNQLVGLNSSTVEMCDNVLLVPDPNTQERPCGLPGLMDFPRGRLAGRTAQYTVATSTLAFDIARRHDLLRDELEIYRRGDAGAPRPACCPPPFDVANNWMHEYPKAYVIPLGSAQRSDAEANRLVEWLLFNGIVVSQLDRPARFGSQTFDRGSYVVWMNQAHRGLADTALGIGVDVSSQIGQLYAPPAAWSHGYLWGADSVTIPAGSGFAASTREVRRPASLAGGVDSSRADRYVLELNSATAVRTLNTLVANGVPAALALGPFTNAGRSYPAGSAIFAADATTRQQLDAAGRRAGLFFRGIAASALPALSAIARVPRIAVLASGPTQELWVMRDLGFTADFVPTGAASDLNNAGAPDPLAAYDIVFNQSPRPAGATAQARLTAFFANHGGYVGAGTNGANFLSSAGEVSGLAAASRSGAGRSGIVHWDNLAGASSPVVGAYPASDTAIMDPPTWFTAVPGSFAVDARLPTTGFFAAGLWLLDAQSASAPGSALIAHGPNAAGTARLTVFAMNPLYRADPEREWPAFASATYWVNQSAATAPRPTAARQPALAAPESSDEPVPQVRPRR
jgi:zinc carboxypeptidase